jgi:hypothetical protein
VRNTLYIKGAAASKPFIGAWRPNIIIAAPRDLEMMRTNLQHIAIFPIPMFYHGQMAMFQQLGDLSKLSTVTWV